ncbi:MAG: tetratricopeptide repeat protein [Desulfuromonadales bacterium]|nr:tetratricopeptide repeat protein [Desulfuromonadales bacterium]
MSRCFVLFTLALLLAACAANQDATIAGLRNQRIEIREVPIEGGIEKAMEGYRRFLEATPTSSLSPEATRRLADLKVETEYGLIADSGATDRPETVSPPAMSADSKDGRRAAAEENLNAVPLQENLPLPGGDEQENDGAVEAVALYQKLLSDHPLYEQNDQVLYQLSRAYGELGQSEEAMRVIERLVHDYPGSRYVDEVQFRRGEYYFMHRRYLDAEKAYKSVVGTGVGTFYYQLALYKLGWTYYKQELYEASLHQFIDLLDYKLSTGYDFDQTADEIEHNRMDDTFRVVSLAFSYLGGADAVADYFAANGKRSFEDEIYSNLAEYYYGKRRYSDAVAAYGAFVSRNPFHRKAPLFQMRVIDIHMSGGFPSLVIDAKKAFASDYGRKDEYWNYYDPSSRPEVFLFLKTNLTDLANHYHALYRDKRHVKDQSSHFVEALRWYREYIFSFPSEADSPAINYQLADLLLENENFAESAVEYEKTAYDYPDHRQSSAAGYAAVYACRQQLAAVAPDDRLPVRHEVVRLSLKFAATFPGHEKVAVVLGAAADDLYDMEAFQQALSVAQQLITMFPEAEVGVLRDAWLIAAHADFKLELYGEAEVAYAKVLELLPEQDKGRSGLIDNLAASIYKQGEQARNQEDYRAAADHFLRVGVMAPTSRFRPTAEYDAAATLIRLQDWKQATSVLLEFRSIFPGHELQSEVTKKIAFVYRQDGQLAQAAAEFERVAAEAQDDELHREALQTAAQLYMETRDSVRALEVYRRYVDVFSEPVDLNLETRDKIAGILKTENAREAYLAELRQIVDIEAAAVAAQTPRSRYLAGNAALVLAEVGYQAFVKVQLLKPFKENLVRKQTLMKVSIREFTGLLDYEVGEVTAAATFYLAEIYAHLSQALMASERPDNLTPLELEQYELAIEDQAFLFEEKAIAVHQNNLELIPLGIYNIWVVRSLQRLAKFIPARYDRPEETSGIMPSLRTYLYVLQQNEPSDTANAAEGTTTAITGSSDDGSVEAETLTTELPAPDAVDQEAPAEAREENL